MWARRGLQACEQQPEKFEHTVSIADLRSRQVLPPHNPTGPERQVQHGLGAHGQA